MKLALIIISVLLIPLNTFIADIVCDSIVDWWYMRMDIYAIIFMLLFISLNLSTKQKLEKYVKFTIYVGIGLTTSDVIDRWMMDVRVFTISDIIMVCLVLMFGYRKHLYVR